MIYIVGYLILGVLVAREIKIRCGRRAAKREAIRADCYNCGLSYHCTNHDDKGYEIAAAVWPLWIFIWPFAAVWYTIKGVGIGLSVGVSLCGQLAEKVGSILVAAPPVKTVRAVNHWFWQDPKDRKKDRQVA